MNHPNNMVQFPSAASLADMAAAKTGGQQQPQAPQPPPGMPMGAQAAQPPPQPYAPMPQPPPPSVAAVPRTAVILATVHDYAQRVPWFVWLGIGAGAAYWYNKKG